MSQIWLRCCKARAVMFINQSLVEWDIHKVGHMPAMFDGAKLFDYFNRLRYRSAFL